MCNFALREHEQGVHCIEGLPEHAARVARQRGLMAQYDAMVWEKNLCSIPSEMGERMPKAAILIVGEDDTLSYTRAQVLSEWQTFAVGPAYAVEAMRVRTLDLLIICQTVKEETARELTAQACKLHPGVKVLATSLEYQERLFVSPEHVVRLQHPAHLRNVVAGMLNSPKLS
jgi:hypothetical protein